MDLTRGNASYQSTMRCSSCADYIDVSAVATHVCAHAPYVPYQYHDEQSSMSMNQMQYQHQSTADLPVRNQRPVLPKLDASLNSRNGLRPSEAASIAHDLGLPSPTGAGSSGRKSPHHPRSRPHKPLTTRPASPVGPVGQDCAFPPFPLKSKRKQAEKDAKRHRAQSTSRSTTSTKTYQHSSSQSTASSVYSNGSGPIKRRTSNTSSTQLSRQGTRDERTSLAPSSPSRTHRSEDSTNSADLSPERYGSMPALVLSDSYNFSAPSSTVSTMPPTPSWPPDSRQPSPKFFQFSNSDLGWTPTEGTIPEERSLEVEAHGDPKHTRNTLETFDKILSPEQLKTGALMFDNPPREPLQRSNRPAPLLDISRNISSDPSLPLSARLPPPPPSSAPSGLSRTITNFFGRHRTKPSAVTTMPLPSFDSPRMRALAPDPPERPKRGESLWDDAVLVDEPKKTRSLSPSAHKDVPLSEEHTIQHIPTEDQMNHKPTRDTAEFIFSFTAQEEPHKLDHRPFDSQDSQMAHPAAVQHAASPQHNGPELGIPRASIDSASSYGSVGFSTHRTGSSKSSLPPPESNGEKPIISSHTPLRLPMLGLSVPSISQPDKFGVESPTDPLYHAGKLSPVPELLSMRWSQSEEQEDSQAANQPSPLPLILSDTQHSSRSGQSEFVPQISPQHPPRSASRDTAWTGGLAHSPAPQPSPPPRSSTRNSNRSGRSGRSGGIKGPCRGCTKLITAGQKSVSSADGRLTGRYHKECFACQTCNEPFSTADFYVFDDHPYCAHHYHVLNDSLCVGCGQGIEGQYLETSDVPGSGVKKFHSKCLQCSTCKVQLNEDYFEFHGKVYCELDAFRAASGPKKQYDTVPVRPSPLVREIVSIEEAGLKGRFPERRTTRLIMT